MKRNRRSTALIRALVIVAVVFAFSGSFAGFADAADKKDVELTLTLGPAGEHGIRVMPAYAKIWRNKPDKPKKINWTTFSVSEYEGLFWEIRYDPSKGGGSVDYFGDVDIDCGTREKKVQPDKKPEIPNAEWPYSVTVYACEDGVKARMLATVDPRIIWKD